MTRDDLVRAVLADPDADGPREAFAAWGVAHGDPQGELARLQLAIARERRTYGRSGPNLAAANALIEQHGATWARDVLAIASQPRFFRGFVESVTIDAPTFLARAPELYAAAPIRALTFVDAASHIAAIAASPHLARLVMLRFYNKSHGSPLGDAGLRTLLASPYLRKLAILDVPFNELGREGIEALCAAKLPALVYAGLGQNRVESPVETYGIDSGEIVNDSIQLPRFGRELEASYGPQPWLHAPSLLSPYPPNEGDV